MYDIRDLILNSKCITKDNYALVDDGNTYLPLLKLYERVYVTDEVCFSGMNAIETDELFFAKEHKRPYWWVNDLSYTFRMIIVQNKDKLEVLELSLKTHNFNEKEMKIKLDLMKIKEELLTKKISHKDILINIFIGSILICEDDKIFPYSGDYALSLIGKNDYSIDVFSSLVLACRVPTLMGIAYLDKTLTEGFKIFLTEFFGMFIESPFKN